MEAVVVVDVIVRRSTVNHLVASLVAGASHGSRRRDGSTLIRPHARLEAYRILIHGEPARDLRLIRNVLVVLVDPRGELRLLLSFLLVKVRSVFVQELLIFNHLVVVLRVDHPHNIGPVLSSSRNLMAGHRQWLLELLALLLLRWEESVCSAFAERAGLTLSLDDVAAAARTDSGLLLRRDLRFVPALLDVREYLLVGLAHFLLMPLVVPHIGLGPRIAILSKRVVRALVEAGRLPRRRSLPLLQSHEVPMHPAVFANLLIYHIIIVILDPERLDYVRLYRPAVAPLVRGRGRLLQFDGLLRHLLDVFLVALEVLRGHI